MRLLFALAGLVGLILSAFGQPYGLIGVMAFTSFLIGEAEGFKSSKKIVEEKNLAVQNLIRLKESGKKIIFYGAPAKATTLLNYYGIDSDLVEFTIEDNPLKVGKYIPNTNIRFAL